MIEKLKNNKKYLIITLVCVLIITLGVIGYSLLNKDVKNETNIDAMITNTGINSPLEEPVNTGLVQEEVVVGNNKDYADIIREDTSFSADNWQESININISDLIVKIQASQQTVSEKNSNFRLKEYVTGGYVGIILDIKTNDNANPNGKLYLTLSDKTITHVAIATHYENGGMGLPSGWGTFEVTNRQALLQYLSKKPIGNLYTTDKNGATVSKGEKMIIQSATYNTGFSIPYLNFIIDYDTFFEGKVRKAQIKATRDWYLSHEGIKYAGSQVNVGVTPDEANEIINNNIEQNILGNEKDFENAFIACQSYKYTTPSLFGSMYTFEIIGPKKGGCEIKNYYIIAGEDEYDDMICVYDNRMTVAQASEKIINDGRTACSGPLADKYKE